MLFVEQDIRLVTKEDPTEIAQGGQKCSPNGYIHSDPALVWSNSEYSQTLIANVLDTAKPRALYEL